MSRVFVVTNHTQTEDQVHDLQCNWSVDSLVDLPGELKTLWGSVPPELDSVEDFVSPVLDWLGSVCCAGDIVWVQGEWGATISVLRWCLRNSIVAVYGTTKRVASERKTSEGVSLTHIFKHVRFRRYVLEN